jgi:hypothetical protein
VATVDDEETRDRFRHNVNMTAGELSKWLKSDESKEAGQHKEDESVGHQSGRRIVALLGRKAGDLSDDDHAHMRKVVGYINRHLAQRPSGDVRETKWRYSLMNWGHDPLKD